MSFADIQPAQGRMEARRTEIPGQVTIPHVLDSSASHALRRPQCFYGGEIRKHHCWLTHHGFLKGQVKMKVKILCGCKSAIVWSSSVIMIGTFGPSLQQGRYTDIASLWFRWTFRSPGCSYSASWGADRLTLAPAVLWTRGPFPWLLWWQVPTHFLGLFTNLNPCHFSFATFHPFWLWVDHGGLHWPSTVCLSFWWEWVPEGRIWDFLVEISSWATTWNISHVHFSKTAAFAE